MKTFNSIEEMLEHVRLRSQEADGRVESWQDVKPGDHFVRFADLEDGLAPLVIYGKVLDPVQSEIDAGADEEEVEYQRKLRDAPHMKHYRFTRSYSELCPEGEYGDVHVSTITLVISEDTFNRAKSAGWPTDPRKMAALVVNASGGSA